MPDPWLPPPMRLQGPPWQRTTRTDIPMIIAQISDTHIRNGAGLMQHVDTAAFLRECVEYLNGLPRLDAVLLTGDIIDDDLAESYDCVKSILQDLKAPCFPCVGNHDSRSGLLELYRGLVPEMAGCTDFVQYSVDRFALRLVAVDTHSPGYAHGEFCQARADELGRLLGGEPHKPTLVFMHHPPLHTGIAPMDDISLAGPDATRLYDVLAAHDNVIHVACGHLHRNVFTVWGALPLSVAPGPAHAITLNLDTDDVLGFTMEPPACRLFRFKDNQLIAHTAYIGDYGDSYPFSGNCAPGL